METLVLVSLQTAAGAEEFASACAVATERALRVDTHPAHRVGGCRAGQLMACARRLGQVLLTAAGGAESGVPFLPPRIRRCAG
jgi:hypothetical protein